jgi:hypothetical protein
MPDELIRWYPSIFKQIILLTKKPSNFVETIKFSQNYEIVSVKIFKYCKKLLNLEKNYQFEKIIKYSQKFQIHAVSYEQWN